MSDIGYDESLTQGQANYIYDALIGQENIRNASRDLFYQGKYRNAILDAMIELETMVKRKAGYPKDSNGTEQSGASLMRHVFNENRPILKWNSLTTQTEKDEFKGYQHIFAGTMIGIRNSKADAIFEQSPRRALQLLKLSNLLAEIVDSCEMCNYENG